MFKIATQLNLIRVEVTRLVEAVYYLIKLLQHTNRVLDPSDSKNPYKLKRNNVVDAYFGLDPVNMWRNRSNK